ncbi:MAG TPA: phosphodiester glycosidase family protein [Hyphomonadaceae bacterium]|jgi:hypothetical protein|nr:phosphodiester glycosidase family protein [Hyphomonadaceae bacterium]
MAQARKRFRIGRRTIIGAAASLVGLFLFSYLYAGGFVLHYMLGGKGWPELSVTDFRLSHAMRRAWEATPPQVRPGAMTWTELAPGFESAELPVLTDKEEIDRFYLARIDPALYDFSVHVDDKNPNKIGDWERDLPNAALIVNGSFFGPGNGPDTPLISNGVAQGPTTYDAQAGAFVAGPGGARVIDLTSGQAWQAAFAGAHNAMVAYPLLIGADGKTHVTRKSRWLSNRTFVGEDSKGRIIIGSTKEAFFSLDREADFLLAASLDLKTALNLDGGPVACRSLRIGKVHQVHIARWEAQEEDGRAHLIHMPLGTSEMPIVLAITPRRRAP